MGNSCAVASAVILAFYTVFLRKIGQNLSPFVTVTWVFTGGVIVVFMIGSILGDPFLISPTENDWLLMLGLAAIGTLASFLLYNASLRYIRSSTAAILALASPLSATCFAMLILSEFPTSLTLAGMCLCIFGIVLVAMKTTTPN